MLPRMVKRTVVSGCRGRKTIVTSDSIPNLSDQGQRQPTLRVNAPLNILRTTPPTDDPPTANTRRLLMIASIRAGGSRGAIISRRQVDHCASLCEAMRCVLPTSWSGGFVVDNLPTFAECSNGVRVQGDSRTSGSGGVGAGCKSESHSAWRRPC
jgi:hypothetical protein